MSGDMVFSPSQGTFRVVPSHRNDVVRHLRRMNRNDLMRHAERCHRTRHCEVSRFLLGWGFGVALCGADGAGTSYCLSTTIR